MMVFKMYRNRSCGCMFVPLKTENSLVLLDCRSSYEKIYPQMTTMPTEVVSSGFGKLRPTKECSQEELVSMLESNIRHARKPDLEEKIDPFVVGLAGWVLAMIKESDAEDKKIEGK